jgi:glycosyltransferase involved in cell wall biosynthesis
MPSVSIAIRAFRQRWLAETIASVLAQTHRDLELVIYDDAGDLEGFATATGDARVRYHRADHHADRGRTASDRFAAAVALCRGVYVGVLDDDDAYAPDFVATLAAALDAEPRAGIAFCRTTWDCGGRRHTPVDARQPGMLADAAVAMLRDGWTVTPSHALFRRAAYDAVFGPAPMRSGVAPDVVLNLRLATCGWLHVLVDAPLVVTRWHDGQLSRAAGALDPVVSTWRMLEFEQPVLAALRDRRLARALVARAFSALQAGETAEAISDLRAAVAASPREWRARRRAIRCAVACGTPGVMAAALYARWTARTARRPPPRIAGS